MINFLKKLIMVSCAGEIVKRINKDLVEEVKSCLEKKRMEMLEARYISGRTIAENLRCDIQDDLSSNGSVLIEATWRIRALDLISRCCEDIKANMNYPFRRGSDNEESSKNGVDDAISNLVHLARVFPHFAELRNLGKHLKELFGERPESQEFKNLLSTRSDDDSEKEKKVREIADEHRWTLTSVMVYVKMIFDDYRIIFQTLLFISEVCSYGLNLTAENNIIILVPILVLSATCFLSINIPLIRRCCRKRTVRVLSQFEWVESAFSEWVESSFSIFQLVADFLKVAGQAESSSKVTEAWVLVFAVIGYVFFLIKRNTNVDGGRSNRGGIRKWIRQMMIKKIKRRY